MYPSPHLTQPQISNLSIPPSEQYQSHQTLFVPLIACNSPQSSTRPMTEFPQMDSGLAVLVFNTGDDPISYLNKAMAFLTVVASSRFLSTNNQLRTSSNLRNQATIQDSRVTMQQEDRIGWLNFIIVKVKDTWLGNALSQRGLGTFQAAQTTILNTAAFQTKDLDAFDSDCDDVSNTKAVLMANLSNYGSDVISKKAQRIKTALYDGSVISSQHAASPMIDDEETLILEELQTSHPNTDQSALSPVKIKAPRELPK
ncbi:hypothetical protein Tco_0564148, partial [Tanacetum coccineum]